MVVTHQRIAGSALMRRAIASNDALRMIRFLHTCCVLAWGSFRNNPRRVGYLGATTAVTVAAWLALSAMAAPFVGTATSRGSGITITNASQTHAPLPLRYAQRIQAIEGVHNLAWFTLQLVNCKQAPDVTVTLNVYGGPGATAAAMRDDVSAGIAAQWNADPAGILITDAAAKDCAWRTGQGVEPPDVMGAKDIPLRVSGIYHGTYRVGLAHFAYINRVDPLFGKDSVLKYLASAGSAQGDELLAARVEAQFAHDFPTVGAATNTTVQNAWARFGKIQQLLALVMSAILLCAGSVWVSVLAHDVAQRRPQFALLQALGFHRVTLCSALVFEIIMTLIAGSLIGLGIAVELARWIAPTSIGMLSGGFVIPTWSYEWMPLWLLALLVAALVWPVTAIMRIQPSDHRAI